MITHSAGCSRSDDSEGQVCPGRADRARDVECGELDSRAVRMKEEEMNDEGSIRLD